MLVHVGSNHAKHTIPWPFTAHHRLSCPTATTGNDTIGMFGPITATPSISAASVIADGGNDLLNFGVQGVTATAQAAWSGSVSGNMTGSRLSARIVGQNALYTASTAITQASGVTGMTVTVTGVTTSYQSLRKLVSSQIYANAGNDTVALGFELDTASASTIGGGAGNDVIGTFRVINDVFSTGVVTGGGAFDSMIVEGGNADTNYFNGASYGMSKSTIQGGQGNDTIAILVSGAGSDLTATQIRAGGGDDVFSGNGQNGLNLSTAIANTIAGGGGNDTINVNFAATAASNYILGDALNNIGTYDGADRIVLGTNANFSSNTIQAGGGNDQLTLSGAQGGSNIFQAQKGDDILSADFGVLTSVTVQMGAGADSVYIYSGGLSGGSLVALGGDNDLFSYSAGMTGGVEAASVATVFGGLGADTFTAGHYNSGTIGFTFGYSSVSDSTITAFDTIQIGNAAASGTYTLQYEPGNATLATTAAANSFTATNGIAVFTGTFDGSVTARYNAIADGVTTEGASTVFWDSGNVTYFFVKGSDANLITQIGSASRGTGTISVAGGKTFTINNN